MIECRNLHKSYRLGHGRREVLKGVNLTVSSGEKVGIIGRNGAGKTTLIKQIGGVELPESGKVIRRMSTSWPLGFNGAFQGSLTGYDNARFIARIYGYNYSDIQSFVEEFSELGGALRMPVKTYSSGMRARLAFALSLAIEFDCYLIDEVMLVGDADFQRKCRFELFEKRGDRAMVIVSHDMSTIREICGRVILLRDGLALEHETIEDTIEEYNRL